MLRQIAPDEFLLSLRGYELMAGKVFLTATRHRKHTERGPDGKIIFTASSNHAAAPVQLTAVSAPQ